MLKLEQQFGLYVISEPLKIGRDRASVRAEDPFFARDVTLKLIGPGAIGGKENLDKLEKQLEALSGLEHPAIAPLYDCGTETGYCYFTTTYFSSGNLAEQLTESCPPERALRILSQISQGLAYAYGEGFEQGKLTLKDIFINDEGQAQIGDFGLNASLKRLSKSASEQKVSAAGNDLTHETLLSLGEMLVKLILGAGAKADKVSLALLEQAHDKCLAELAADLLGESEQPISGFTQLVERLQQQCKTDQGEASFEATSAETNSPTDTLTKKEMSSGSQRQREIKEAVYAKAEVRRLVEEKCKLQENLKRAVYYKKITEQKISDYQHTVNAARKDLEKARFEAAEAWKIATSTRPVQRPAVWLASGFLAGILLTGSIGYFQYGNLQPPTQLARVETTALQESPAAEESKKPEETRVETNVQPPINLPEESLSELALEKSWWPLGGEFNPGMVVSTARAEAADMVEIINQNLGQPPSSPPSIQTQTSEPMEQKRVVAATSSLWWPAGSEFNQQAAMPVKNLRATAISEHEKILALVNSWATAWSNQNLEQYFSYYSADYRPETGYSQEQWRDRRRSRLERPEWIQVGYDDLRLNFISDKHVQVKLKQNYQSDFYQDKIRKSLNLIKENDQWRIVMERSLGPVNS